MKEKYLSPEIKITEIGQDIITLSESDPDAWITHEEIDPFAEEET